MPLNEQEMSDKLDSSGEEEKLDPDVSALIRGMWTHPTTQEVFERKSEFQLNDSAE